MATGFQFFESTTPGAPQLPADTQAGGWIAVLDYILSPTYWDKQALATNKAAYRAKAGHRKFLYVDDSRTAASSKTIVRMYDNVVSEADKTGPTPDLTQLALSDFGWWRKYTASTNYWKAVVTDRFFIVWAEVSYNGIFAFFGDVPGFGQFPGIPVICGSGLYSNPVSFAYYLFQSSTIQPFAPDTSKVTFNSGAYGFSASNCYLLFTPRHPDGASPPARMFLTSVACPSSSSYAAAGALGVMTPVYDTFVCAPFSFSAVASPETVARIPFLYQLGRPYGHSGSPANLDTFTDTTGNGYVSLSSSGSQASTSFHVNLVLATTDQESDLP